MAFDYTRQNDLSYFSNFGIAGEDIRVYFNSEYDAKGKKTIRVFKGTAEMFTYTQFDIDTFPDKGSRIGFNQYLPLPSYTDIKTSSDTYQDGDDYFPLVNLQGTSIQYFIDGVETPLVVEEVSETESHSVSRISAKYFTLIMCGSHNSAYLSVNPVWWTYQKFNKPEERIEDKLKEQVGNLPAVVIPQGQENQTACYTYTYDSSGSLISGVKIQARLRAIPDSVSGSFSQETIQSISDENGLATFYIPRGEDIIFEARRGNGEWISFTGDDVSSLEIKGLLDKIVNNVTDNGSYL